jgi:hemoglobin/transferrin/lactoferrin receptor protein
MNRITIAIILLGLLFAVAASADTFKGRIVNVVDGRAVPGATILIQQEDRFIETDDNGEFSFTTTKTPVLISVSHVGFAMQRNINLESAGNNIVRLNPSTSSLDNIVVTANRFSREAYKTTQPITIVGRQEMIDRGNNSVTDVIRDFPGLDLNDTGPFRARPVIRGLFGTRILVLVDGERLNDQRDISSFAGVSMSLVDVNEIDRIEVVNGPSSVLYGSDAMGGVINIITRNNNFAADLTPRLEYTGRYATAGEQHMNRFDLGFGSERWAGSVGFMYRKAEENFDPPDGWNETDRYHVFDPSFYTDLNSTTGREFAKNGLVNTRAEISNIDAKLAYKLSDKYRLDADLGVFRGSDIGYPGVPNDSTPFLFFYPRHDRDNFAVSINGNNISERLSKITGRLYYEKISKDFLTDFLGSVTYPDRVIEQPFGPPIFIWRTLGTSLNRTEVTKIGLNFQEIYTVRQNSQLTFGFDYLNEHIDGQVISTDQLDSSGVIEFETGAGASVPKNTWNNLGLYISGETEFNPILITAGIRYDNFWINTRETPGYAGPIEDEHYNAVNGSFGLTLSMSETVNLVGNVGTAYRVPNVVERFFNGSASGRQTRPNPDIKPEKSVSFDFGVKAIHESIKYSLMGFYNDYEDFTQLQNFDYAVGHGGSTPLWRYENVEDVKIYGFEFLIETDTEEGFHSSLSITYQRGENKTIDQPLFVSPLKSSLTLGYRHKKPGIFGSFTIKMVEDQDRIPDVAYLDDIATRGYWRLDALAGIQINKYVRLSIAGNNLLDELYSEPFNARNPDNPVPEPGRNFIFSITAGL